MINDSHFTWGWILGKSLFGALTRATGGSKGSGIIRKLLRAGALAGTAPLFAPAALKPTGGVLGVAIITWYNSLSSQQRFSVVMGLLANLPDVDSITWLGPPNALHRTATHSIITTLAFWAPMAASSTNLKWLLFGGAEQAGEIMLDSTEQWVWTYIVVVAAVFSHLVTDWISKYGLALWWPVDKTFYGMGAITVADLSTLFVSYGSWMAVRSESWTPSTAWIVLAGWMAVRRWWYYHHWRRTAPVPGRQWLQPSNTWPATYFLMSLRGKKEDGSHHVTLDNTAGLREIWSDMIEWRTLPKRLWDCFIPGAACGYTHHSPPHGSFPTLRNGSSESAAKVLTKDTGLSIAVIIAQHFLSPYGFFNWLLGRLLNA